MMRSRHVQQLQRWPCPPLFWQVGRRGSRSSAAPNRCQDNKDVFQACACACLYLLFKYACVRRCVSVAAAAALGARILRAQKWVCSHAKDCGVRVAKALQVKAETREIERRVFNGGSIIVAVSWVFSSATTQ